jgi:hypothetical protein
MQASKRGSFNFTTAWFLWAVRLMSFPSSLVFTCQSKPWLLISNIQ